MALVNNAELVIDDISGFVRDRTYQRRYQLDHFNIPCRKAMPAERLVPFERYRRGYAKWRSRRLPYEHRSYLVQELKSFDPRLLGLRIKGDVYIDGLWQGEAYFADIAKLLRKELTIKPPTDILNQKMAAQISECAHAVAVHVQWFDTSAASLPSRNVTDGYYQRAVDYVKAHVEQPHFYLFSDNPLAAAARLSLPEGAYTVVSHNVGDELAYADLWLISQCRHFITANSTFSWWGAWLGEKFKSLVLTPDPDSLDPGNSWCAEGLLPSRWTKL